MGMNNARELLARLGPTSVRLDAVGGGRATLTNQDIAHALGMVDAGLGREVLECCYLDSGVRPTRALRDHLLKAVCAEWRRQDEVMLTARTNLAFHHAMANFARAVSPDLRREIDQARAEFDEAKVQCWPRDAGEMLPAITLAVLQEIAGSSACDSCGGAKMVPCARCGGEGYVAWSERTRATAIMRSQAVYHRVWSGMYSWILDLLRDAERSAFRQFSRALADKDPT